MRESEQNKLIKAAFGNLKCKPHQDGFMLYVVKDGKMYNAAGKNMAYAHDAFYRKHKNSIEQIVSEKENNDPEQLSKIENAKIAIIELEKELQSADYSEKQSILQAIAEIKKEIGYIE